VAILWTSTATHEGYGFETQLSLDVAFVTGARIDIDHRNCFRHIETGVHNATTYRGKVLPLETGSDERGNSGGISVHRLRSVDRDDVILPEATVRLLERNVIRLVAQRPELARLGIPTKKGLLFYGPPGTGKTRTLFYLLGALAGHTALTAERNGRPGACG
jgi:hypothetical protein